VGERGIGVQGDALLEFELRRLPLPVEPQPDVTQRDVRLGKRRIELDRLQRGGLRLGNRFHPE
jgi:hypothetical protein